jgi:hypothetical protein
MRQFRIIDLPFIGRFIHIPKKHHSLTYPGGMSFHSSLKATVTHKDGSTEEYDLGSGLVTTAGVDYLADDMAGAIGAADATNFNYHASGTGTTAAAIGDTAMQTDSGVARVAGTQTNPVHNVYRTVATMSYVSSLAITEWGLFSASTVGTLWDRKVFTAINVVSGDSIQFTYDLTINAGG